MSISSYPKRVIAWLIDMHISMISLIIAYVVSSKAFSAYQGWKPWAIAIFSYSVWWMIGFVNRCITMGRTGQSWGRMLFNISLISEDSGSPIGIWKAFLRENTHFVDYGLLCYGWIRPLWNSHGKTFADSINKTITIDGEPPWAPLDLNNILPRRNSPGNMG